MKFSFTSFSLIFLAFFYSFLAEALAVPVNVTESSALESRAPAADHNTFLTWLQSPVGTSFTNICFWSGSTNNRSVETVLPALVNRIGCEYSGSLLTRAGIPKADSDTFTLPQWAEISKQIARNTRGHTNALLGAERRPDAIWAVDELPILKGSIGNGLVTGIDLWGMDAGGNLSGPTPFVP